jgi:hypothetical protein
VPQKTEHLHSYGIPKTVGSKERNTPVCNVLQHTFSPQPQPTQELGAWRLHVSVAGVTLNTATVHMAADSMTLLLIVCISVQLIFINWYSYSSIRSVPFSKFCAAKNGRSFEIEIYKTETSEGQTTLFWFIVTPLSKISICPQAHHCCSLHLPQPTGSSSPSIMCRLVSSCTRQTLCTY